MKISDVTPVSTSEHLSLDSHKQVPSGEVQTRAILPFSWHALICGGLACAFVVTSVPKILEACRGVPGPATPFHTTDYFLSALLGTPHGSQRLIQVFSTLPADHPVAVLIPEADWGNTFTAYIMTYFAWPREVQLVEVNRQNARAKLEVLDQTALSAIFFCGITPPASFRTVIRLGTDLTVVTTPLERNTP